MKPLIAFHLWQWIGRIGRLSSRRWSLNTHRTPVREH